ncbi:hypothetical protein TNCV_2864251 [Trichonephila clavipes]|nr:hypothetical protein TNCV_2864251 [Trichonephila clavipes]
MLLLFLIQPCCSEECQPRNAADPFGLLNTYAIRSVSLGEWNTNSSTTMMSTKERFFPFPQGHFVLSARRSVSLPLIQQYTGGNQVARCVAVAAVLKSNVRLWIEQCDHAFAIQWYSSDILSILA